MPKSEEMQCRSVSWGQKGRAGEHRTGRSGEELGVHQGGRQAWDEEGVHVLVGGASLDGRVIVAAEHVLCRCVRRFCGGVAGFWGSADEDAAADDPCAYETVGAHRRVEVQFRSGDGLVDRAWGGEFLVGARRCVGRLDQLLVRARGRGGRGGGRRPLLSLGPGGMQVQPRAGGGKFQQGGGSGADGGVDDELSQRVGPFPARHADRVVGDVRLWFRHVAGLGAGVRGWGGVGAGGLLVPVLVRVAQIDVFQHNLRVVQGGGEVEPGVLGLRLFQRRGGQGVEVQHGVVPVAVLLLGRGGPAGRLAVVQRGYQHGVSLVGGDLCLQGGGGLDVEQRVQRVGGRTRVSGQHRSASLGPGRPGAALLLLLLLAGGGVACFAPARCPAPGAGPAVRPPVLCALCTTKMGHGLLFNTLQRPGPPPRARLKNTWPHPSRHRSLLCLIAAVRALSRAGWAASVLETTAGGKKRCACVALRTISACGEREMHIYIYREMHAGANS